jgi:dihydroorotate dehydrogenase (fumarate)
MPDLSTTYMGIALRNPVMVAACSLSGRIETIESLQEHGAAALVVKSLFEEQILHEMNEFDEMLSEGSQGFSESLGHFPQVEHAGAKEHLMWTERARKATSVPLIASLNAVTPGRWVEYARQLAETGVDALELNAYAVETDFTRTAAEVETRLMETFEAVKGATDLPVAVKLSPFYSSLGNVVRGLKERGADAVVLCNRFLQPDIDTSTERSRCVMSPSTPQELRIPLRWIGLLHGRIDIEMAGNTGVASADDVVKYLLAGAAAVQVASILYADGPPALKGLVDGLASWMTEKGYETLADFRGKASQRAFEGNVFAWERAQYLDFILSTQKP